MGFPLPKGWNLVSGDRSSAGKGPRHRARRLDAAKLSDGTSQGSSACLMDHLGLHLHTPQHGPRTFRRGHDSPHILTSQTFEKRPPAFRRQSTFSADKSAFTLSSLRGAHALCRAYGGKPPCRECLRARVEQVGRHVTRISPGERGQVMSIEVTTVIPHSGWMPYA